jgi:hypothetical protein
MLGEGANTIELNLKTFKKNETQTCFSRNETAKTDLGVSSPTTIQEKETHPLVPSSETLSSSTLQIADTLQQLITAGNELIRNTDDCPLPDLEIEIPGIAVHSQITHSQLQSNLLGVVERSNSRKRQAVDVTCGTNTCI